jgi:hypothetical protein
LGHHVTGINARERNAMWKGDNVRYIGLHVWVKNHLPKPSLCEMCNLVPALDLANITGKYTRALENWKYFCRSCHMKSDGRMIELVKMSNNSKGRVSWRKGKVGIASEATRQKMSESQKRAYVERRRFPRGYINQDPEEGTVWQAKFEKAT